MCCLSFLCWSNSILFPFCGLQSPTDTQLQVTPPPPPSTTTDAHTHTHRKPKTEYKRHYLFILFKWKIHNFWRLKSVFDPFPHGRSAHFLQRAAKFFFLSHRSRLPLVPPIERWYFPLLRYRREDGIPAADWTTPVFPTSLGINGKRSGSTSGQNRSRRMEDVRSSVRTASQSQVAEMLNLFEIIRQSVIYIYINMLKLLYPRNLRNTL